MSVPLLASELADGELIAAVSDSIDTEDESTVDAVPNTVTGRAASSFSAGTSVRARRSGAIGMANTAASVETGAAVAVCRSVLV